MSKTGKRPLAAAAGKRTKTVSLMAIAIVTAAPSSAAPPVASITLYCGGGVTGGGGGLIVQADGDMLHIGRERPREPDVLKRTTVPREQVMRWHAMLDAAGFDSLPRGEPSNMTCSLSRRSSGGKHVVLWGGGRPLPRVLRDVVEEIRAAGRND
jgi:hypothetical protein